MKEKIDKNPRFVTYNSPELIRLLYNNIVSVFHNYLFK